MEEELEEGHGGWRAMGGGGRRRASAEGVVEDFFPSFLILFAGISD